VSRPPADDPRTVDGDGVARNAAYALAVQLTTSAFTATLTIFLVRALGPSGYGVFALAVALGALLALLAELGISASGARFVAEHRGDRAAVAALIADAFRLKLVLATAVSLLLFAVAGPIAAAYDQDELTWPLRAIAIAVFGQALMALLGGLFIAQGKVFLNLRLALSEGAIEVGTTITLVLLGAGAAGAAFGRATGYVLGAAVAIALTVRSVGRSSIALRGGAGRTREIARYAGALALVDAAVVLFDQIDAILIGAFLGTASVGLFQAPMRVTTFLLYPGYAIANGVAPRLARTARHQPNAAALQGATRMIILFQAALIAPLLVWAGPITGLLFGADYEKSADVMRALVPFVFLSGLAPLVSLGANYLGLARRRVPIAVAALLVNFAIDLILIPRIGIVGGAIGTGAAYVIYVPAHVWVCWRALDLELRPVVTTLVRALVAASAMSGVLLVAGTSRLSLLDWIAGGLAGLLVFLVALVVTGALTAVELRTARVFVLRPLTRLRGAA
jgi:O-antigen/teichoic acid export membrane protein